MYITQTLHGEIDEVSLVEYNDFTVMILRHAGDKEVSMFFHGADGMDKVRRFCKQIEDAIGVAAFRNGEVYNLGEQGDGTFRVERSA